MEYELTEEDLAGLEPMVYPLREPAIIRAARDPDSRYLSALLRYGKHGPRGSEPTSAWRPEENLDPNVWVCGDEYGRWLTIPVLTAVESGNQDNVRVLVAAGADPNGVDMENLKLYASEWVRRPDGITAFEYLCPSKQDKVLEDPSQLDPMQESERIGPLSMSRWSGETIDFGDYIVPFWTKYPPHDSWHSNDNHDGNGRRVGNAPMTSLMKAAHRGNIEMFDLLVEVGADASYWRQPTSQWPGSRNPSSVARSTPLHLAIQAGRQAMVEHLLQSGFNPNIRPLVNPITATTPLMASVICHDTAPWAYALLASHSEADFEICTTYCRIHLAHFAAANYKTELLEDIVRRTSFDLTTTTELGQNLLHITYLPVGANDLFDSPAKQATLHNSRCLILPYMRGSSSRQAMDKGKDQMVEWLSARCPELVTSKDVHGNTPLHYYACSWSGFKYIPQILRDYGPARDVWENVKNAQGYTPREVSEA